MAIITKRYYPATNATNSNSEWRMIWNGSYYTSATLDREDAIQFSAADKSEIINNLAIIQSIQLGFNLASINFYPANGCTISGRNISLITPPKATLYNGGFTYLASVEYILSPGARTLPLQNNISDAINNGIGIRISGSADTDPGGQAPPNSFYGTATATYGGVYLDVAYNVPEGSTPTISNLSAPSFNIELDNNVTWDSTNQASYNLKAYNSQGSLLYEKNGGTEKTCLIPASSINVIGSVRFVVTVYNATSIGTLSAVSETTVNTVGYVPTVANLSPNAVSLSIDDSITITWTSAYQSSFKLTVDGKIYTGTTANSFILPPNTLIPGTKTITLEVTYQGVGYTSTASTTASFTGYGKTVSITALEPSGVNQNIDMPITVSWTSTNQSTFKLVVDGKTYTGSTAKSLTLQSNALTSGAKTMTLEVTYQGIGYTSTANKTVTFLAYGKPPIPIQDSVTSYRSVLPVLTWTSSEQVAYRVKIMQGETLISDSNEVISTALSYTVPTALTNLTSYRSLIQVKNQYGLWSDNSEKTFEISYTEMPQPTISSYGDVTNSSIVTNFEIVDAVGFAKNELWRKEQYGEWIRIAYNMSQKDVYVDNYVKANTEYSYKCRAVDIYGGISESDIITASTQVTNFRFYDLEDFDNFIELVGEPTVTPTRIKNKAVTLYAGCPAPSIETDGVVYNTYDMEFEVSKAELDKFIDITDKAKVILFRDCRGNKAFGQVISNISPAKTRAIDSYSIKFTFMDVAFLERDVYNGAQHAILLYFDGTWLFDGSQYFTGFRSW